LSGGIGEIPVEVTLPRVDGTSVAASHRYDDVGGPHNLVGKWLGKLLRQVEPDLVHDRTDVLVDFNCRR
jgi:hypothetical protein